MNSKALENFLIPEVATEGFFNKFKSLRNNKSFEKIDPEKKKKFEIANNKYEQLVKRKDELNKQIQDFNSRITTLTNKNEKIQSDIDMLVKLKNHFIIFSYMVILL